MGLAVGVVVARLLGRVEVQRGGVDAIPDMGEKDGKGCCNVKSRDIEPKRRVPTVLNHSFDALGP